MTALALFSVSHAGISLRVRVLPAVADVDREYRDGRRRRDGRHIHAYFRPASRSGARHLGTITLAGNGRIEELVPHEVTHAVLHRLGHALLCSTGTVLLDDEERFATAVGILTARILARLGRLGFAS